MVMYKVIIYSIYKIRKHRERLKQSEAALFKTKGQLDVAYKNGKVLSVDADPEGEW